MITTGNWLRTHPAKRAVTLWVQGPTTWAPTGHPRRVHSRQLGGTQQSQDDPQWTLPWPKLDRVVVARLICLFN